ncbi:MAG: glycosyltransferase, exosortase A system-associated [Deltaproteobacteria bacterium]|nr:glycosyltransferase, exosortase A system-associated [Deltaproteobacteria bacterium]
MKILHVLDHSLPLHSGYTFRSQEIFLSQQKMGLRPLALTSPKHEQSWTGDSQDGEIIAGIPYFRTGSLSRRGLPFASELSLMARLARRIHQIAVMEKADLLHAHSPILNGLPALWVGRKLGLPVVYEIRAFWEDAAADHRTYAEDSRKYKLVRHIETWLCRRVDEIVVICRGLEDDLIQRGIPPEKISVVYNGINTHKFQISLADREHRDRWGLSGKKVIGFIGSFYRYEGLDLLVDAFAQLASSRPDVSLLLVGGGEMENELKAQVNRLGLDGKVVMPGEVPHERVPGIYSTIDILAYPRYSKRLTELVTPLKPLEAMAMGKALVASDVGGHRELIRHGETGLLFPAGDVSSLVSALQHLLNASGLRKQMERQGTVWSRTEHSWKKTTAMYSEIYSRAIAKRAGEEIFA